jgi:hypothetical protein
MKKPSFHYCVRLDTFAVAADPEEPATARRASSAHTYRLLIFKDRVRNHHPNRTCHSTTGTASFCVAASAAEKRDYEESFSFRQLHFSLSLKTLLTLRPLVSAAALVHKRGGEY